MTIPLRLALAGAFALVAATVAWSIGSPPVEAPERRSNIANMTEAERDQLRRRYETFRKLSEPEREAIRRLHAEVERDQSLKRTFDDYGAFVSRLDPWDQQELRQLEDPDERLVRVKKLVARYTRSNEPWKPSWLSGRFVEGTVLPPPEFDQAMDLLANSLQLTRLERDELGSLKPHIRHLKVTQRAAEKIRSDGPGRNWPDVETADAILKLLPEGRSKQWALDDERSAEDRRTWMFAFLTRSLLAEWQLIVPRVVTPAEFKTALEKVNDRDQADWARHDPSRLQREIVEELEKQEGTVGDFARDFAQVVSLRVEFDPFANMRFGRSSSERGSSDGRRDADRRDSDRDDSDRGESGPAKFGPGSKGRDRRDD